MGLKEGERLYLFEGVRHCYCEQFAFFQGYVPEDIGRNIQKREVQGPLLIECVERKALKKVKRARQAISAMAAGEKIAKSLKSKKVALPGREKNLFCTIRQSTGNGNHELSGRRLPESG